MGQGFSSGTNCFIIEKGIFQTQVCENFPFPALGKPVCSSNIGGQNMQRS